MGDIVVGVDGSEHSAEALRWAAGEAAARPGSRVVAVLVWELFNQRHADGTRRFDPDYDDASADRALAQIVDDALGVERGRDVVRRPVCDRPAPGLLAAAEDADLLVVGARGLGGFTGLLLGSVSQQCVHHATGPVAVVRGEQTGEADAGRVVVGVDGSDSSAAALRWALADAAARGATLQVVHSWQVPIVDGAALGSFAFDVTELEASAHRLVDDMIAEATPDGPPVSIERTVVTGGPAQGLLDAAKAADVVVVGRRGLGGFGRMLLGSVSDRVVRHADTTVVVVPADPADG